MEDGSTVEVGTVGNEGFVGVPVALGTTRPPLRSFAQIPGVELRMTSEDLREELQRYIQALFSMLSQASACNRTHAARQRLALWLLLCHDWVGRDTFPL